MCKEGSMYMSFNVHVMFNVHVFKVLVSPSSWFWKASCEVSLWCKNIVSLPWEYVEEELEHDVYVCFLSWSDHLKFMRNVVVHMKYRM